MTQKPNGTLQIERTDSYKVGDRFFGNLTDAKREALIPLLPDDIPDVQAANIASSLIEDADAVIEILAWGDHEKKPKRKPRSDKGGSHKKSAEENATPTLPGVKVEGSGKYKGQ